MHHHLSRLLRHRLLLPAASTPSAAAFSTSSKRTFARRAKPPPAEEPAAVNTGGDAAAAAAPVADGTAEAKAAWQREKLPGELPRPPTIPFQPRVANTVRLVGTVGAPVHLQRTADGRFSAVSVLVQDSRVDFPKFWVPIVFKDDLAQVAASHLKEKDLVYVSGQLTCDVPPLKLDDGQANIQACYKNKWDKFNKLWNDVITKPEDWNDNRPQKKNGSRSVKYPDFKHKVSKEALWLDSAPTTVLEKLDDVVFGGGYAARREDKPYSTSTNWSKFRKSPDASAVSKQEEELWRDLVDNPANWWDNRTDKLTPKHPDFKNKDSGKGLWIGTKSPQWAVDALPSLKFKGGSKGTRKQETLLS
ncbi:Protein OSB4, chloroplastic [Dichanthelium oligosanthes]|uniref:Protein OSB4, chloroplastic n=1 Tax=Dichanthelium oligosanthes TaxID=888268 RepID=A0A1E5VD56_9POAL|nr:Protein OSB4, chloroplastic [Dichanthelium oligosanthes]